MRFSLYPVTRHFIGRINLVLQLRKPRHPSVTVNIYPEEFFGDIMLSDQASHLVECHYWIRNAYAV